MSHTGVVRRGLAPRGAQDQRGFGAGHAAQGRTRAPLESSAGGVYHPAHHALHLRQTSVSPDPPAGRRLGHVRQSRHHRAAAHGRSRPRARHPLRAGAAGGARHRDDRRLRAGQRRPRRGKRPRVAGPGQRDGDALRRLQGGLAAAGDRGPARPVLHGDRADPLVGSAAGGAAVREVVDGSASPGRPAAHRAPRGEDGAGASDRTGLPLAAGRRAERRARHRPRGLHACGPAAGRRSRGDRRGGPAPGARRAAAAGRRRCGRPVGRSGRARRAGGAAGRLGRQRGRGVDLQLPVLAPAQRRDVPAAGAADPRLPDASRPAVLDRRRPLHALAALRRGADAARTRRHPHRRRSVGDRQELRGGGRHPGRSQGDVARAVRGGPSALHEEWPSAGRQAPRGRGGR